MVNISILTMVYKPTYNWGGTTLYNMTIKKDVYVYIYIYICLGFHS